MKTGVVVYSRTDHTLSAARTLEERLSADGHEMALERLVRCKATHWILDGT